MEPTKVERVARTLGLAAVGHAAARAAEQVGRPEVLERKRESDVFVAKKPTEHLEVDSAVGE